jgi:hyperosmotically inducible periplasmic protein
MRSHLMGLTVSFLLAGIISAAPISAAPDRDHSDRSHATSAKDRSVGRVLTDATITGKVKSALIGDKQVEARTINVDTVNGVVHLRGAVPTRTEAKRAIAVAKKVDGVKGVKSHLKISKGKSNQGHSTAKRM